MRSLEAHKLKLTSRAHVRATAWRAAYVHCASQLDSVAALLIVDGLARFSYGLQRPAATSFSNSAYVEAAALSGVLLLC